MSKFILLLVGLLLAVVLVAPSGATYVTGIALEVNQSESPAVAGQIFKGSLTILGEENKQLTGFYMEGESWRNLTWTPINNTLLGPDYPLVVEFSGIPQAANSRLTIIASCDDQVIRRNFTFGGQEYEKRRSSYPLKQADFHLPDPVGRNWPTSLSVEPKLLTEIVPPKAGDTSRSRDIRIRGQFVYVRADTLVVGADGLTIHVWDDDPFVDDHLGTSITDPYGFFDFTVQWDPQIGEDNPDLLVEFFTENSKVILRPPGAITAYVFAHGPLDNYSGTDLNIGGILPFNEEDNAIPHLISNYTHFWRYIAMNGHDTRFLEVDYPIDEDDGAHYNRVSETIYLPPNRAWNSGTQAHEFGHFVMDCLADLPTIHYCNEICDDNYPWDCSHCIWCEEDQAIAWSEGFANYTGHVIPLTFAGVYGIPCLNFRNMEELRICDEDGVWAEPMITEGFTSAALVDFNDNEVDDDGQTPGFTDNLFLGERVILDVLHQQSPMTTMEFMHDLMDHVPGSTEEIWQAAMNNSFNLDEEPPDPVYPVMSSTHEANVPTANPNLVLTWQRPNDDASGVRGYVVYLSTGGNPIDPGVVMNHEGSTIRNYEGLAPGTYYFNIRSVDWDGNLGEIYTSWGPYIITEPDPRNLVFNLPDGWWFYVLPSNTDDVSQYDCPQPLTLDSTLPTFWNLAGRNEGDISTGADLYTALRVDGVEKGRRNWGDMPGWGTFMAMNEGPLLVLGGLHTITGSLDPDGLISETDETDNLVGKQFSWRPPVIESGHVYQNIYPVPEPTAGWDSINDMFKMYNCYGMSFTSSGWWNAFVMWADDAATDYDLRLHEVNESPFGGFRIYSDASNQPAGWVDALVVNRNQTGNILWDAAMVNSHDDEGTLRYKHVTSELVAYGDSFTVEMGELDFVILREFQVGDMETGGISLDIWTDPPQANVSFSWRDSDFSTGDIMEADGLALTGSDGHAHLEVVALTEGYTCMMVSRQPMDGDATLQVTIRIRPALPDLEPAYLAGWYAPIVPRPVADANSSEVELPSTLIGDVSSTWFNFAAGNTSTGMAWGAMRFYVEVDDFLTINHFYLLDIPGGESRSVLNNGPYSIRGGRHTAVLNLDGPNYISELNENNNTYGRQYVWSPLELNSDVRVTRDIPPERVGGWGNISAGYPAYFNCDGLRSAFTGTYWRAIAVMPGADSDVDVRLHEIESGTQYGFGANLRQSHWGVGQSDYVVVNFNQTDRRAFDVGVLAMSGYQDYTAEVIHEQWLGTGALDFGPTLMTADQMLDLYEIELLPGNWRISLENTAGIVDWGITLHPADMAYMNKTDALQDAAAWYGEAGQGEEITVSITETGYYAIAVWKVGSADLPEEGQYILHVEENDTSPVPDTELPLLTRVSGIYPNPFNPQTTIEFELAHASEVDLAVFDVTGRRITTLMKGDLPAGKFSHVWDGKDSARRRVASGVYMIRFMGDHTTDLKKVMLVK